MNKESAFEVSEVVNWLLDHFDSSQFSLTNLKLNKLVYFLHGVSLARDDRPLIRNRFECWTNGPVVASLYHRLKAYGDNPVLERVTYTNYSNGLVEAVPTTRVEAEMNHTLRKAAVYFAEKSAGWLVSTSHAEGGPWARAKLQTADGERNVVISDIEIKEHFVNIYGGKRLH